MTSLDIIIRISHRLDELERPSWFKPLLNWLSTYEGLANFMDSDPAPEVQLLDSLNIIQTSEPNESIIANLVRSLNFLKWRVQFIDGIRWDPSKQSLTLFLQQQPEQKPYAWKWDNTYPSEENIAQSLHKLIQANDEEV